MCVCSINCYCHCGTHLLQHCSGFLCLSFPYQPAGTLREKQERDEPHGGRDGCQTKHVAPSLRSIATTSKERETHSHTKHRNKNPRPRKQNKQVNHFIIWKAILHRGKNNNKKQQQQEMKRSHHPLNEGLVCRMPWFPTQFTEDCLSTITTATIPWKWLVW